MKIDIEDIKILNTCLEHCFGGSVNKMAKAFRVSRQTLHNWRTGAAPVMKLALAFAEEILKKKGKYHYVKHTKNPLATTARRAGKQSKTSDNARNGRELHIVFGER